MKALSITPLPVFLHEERPAVRLEGRLYRWSRVLNNWQDKSSWTKGDQIGDYFEMKWRGELGVVAKVEGQSLPAEKWEFVIG